ncbi:MAG: hypothetical protein K9N62_08630 [Verrucomicrobia bacterium]|nr:hypothetical protein [Verrucomicrobiota bacterium]
MKPSFIKSTFAHLPHRSAAIDAGMILGFLFFLNGLFSPLDLGWLTLHPSPYFLLPLLMGSRYGFAAGSLSGLMAAGTIASGLMFLEAMPFATLFKLHGALLGNFIFVGGICGELRRGFRNKEVQLTQRNEVLHKQLRDLDVDLALLRESKAELEEMLATENSELSTLDSELRQLFDADEEEIFPSLLLLLNRQLRITDGAIYTVAEDDSLKRRACFGQTDHLPEKIDPGEIEIIDLAVRNKTTVTLPEIWKDATPHHADYLIVVPLLNSEEKVMGLVAVTNMPFIALNRKAVSLASLICRWASRIVEKRILTHTSSQPEQGRLFDTAFFREHTELALDSYRSHGLPASIVLFTVPPDCGISQNHLERAIMASVRSGDCPAVLDLPSTHLTVLLPLTGERGVSIFINRILINCRKDPKLAKHIRSRWIRFESHQNLDSIWTELTRDVEEPALDA